MHGTFRGRIEDRHGSVVRFDAPLAEPSRENASDEGKRRLKHAALLTGACLALLPANPRGGEPAQPPSDTPVQLRVPENEPGTVPGVAAVRRGGRGPGEVDALKPMAFRSRLGLLAKSSPFSHDRTAT